MRQNVLPPGWSWCTLSDVAASTPNAIVDGPFGSSLKTSDYVEQGVPVLQGKNVTNDEFRWLDVRFISETKAYELRRSKLQEGDILLVKIGSIGYSAIVDDLRGHSYAIIPANLAKITPNLEKIDLRYLFRWLTSSPVKEYLTQAASKTAQPALSLSKIKALPVPLPPLVEQQRIAAILDEADALRRKRREALIKLEVLLQSVFSDLFGDPACNSKRWPLVELSHLLRTPLQNGAYFPKEQYTDDSSGVEMVHMSDAFYGIVTRGEMKRVSVCPSTINKYLLSTDDLLVARRSLNYEGSVKPCLIPDSTEPLIFESSLIRVSPNQSLIRKLYLYHFLVNERARQRYVLPLVTQSTISGINQANLLQVEVPLPDLELQLQFENNVNQITRIRDSYEHSLIINEQLFESLQHGIFGTGGNQHLIDSVREICLTSAS